MPFYLKIPNKKEFQQIAVIYSSDIDFKDFMNTYKKLYCRTIFFLVKETTLPPDKP